MGDELYKLINDGFQRKAKDAKNRGLPTWMIQVEKRTLLETLSVIVQVGTLRILMDNCRPLGTSGELPEATVDDRAEDDELQ